jgi:nucleotide-binding universal stress UspA family protein
MFHKILVANDGSEGGNKALSAAIALARQLRAALYMISVEELPRFPTTIDELIEEKAEANQRFDRVIEHARAQAKAARVELEARVVAGHALPRIVEFVEREGCDLLIVGFMGHSALYNRIIGSTTDRLVDLAPCSILVIK